MIGVGQDAAGAHEFVRGGLVARVAAVAEQQGASAIRPAHPRPRLLEVAKTRALVVEILAVPPQSAHGGLDVEAGTLVANRDDRPLPRGDDFDPNGAARVVVVAVLERVAEPLLEQVEEVPVECVCGSAGKSA